MMSLRKPRHQMDASEKPRATKDAESATSSKPPGTSFERARLRDVLGEGGEEGEGEDPLGGEAVVAALAPRDELERLEVGEREHEDDAVEAGRLAKLVGVDERPVAPEQHREGHGRADDGQHEEEGRQQRDEPELRHEVGVGAAQVGARGDAHPRGAREDNVGGEVAGADEDARKAGGREAVERVLEARAEGEGGREEHAAQEDGDLKE
eukprot:2198011-Prymnesium_polylepis.1